MKVLIIEDEKAAVRNLKAVLEEVAPDMEVINVLDCVGEAIDWFRTHTMPDLVFMDIHLADGAAFEIFEHTDITCPIIFTTAYDEYALKAFKVNSIAYLLKPIGEKEMRAALDKLKQLCLKHPDEPDIRALMRTLEQEKNYKTHILVPVKGDRLLPLAVHSVACFYIADGIVKAVTMQGKTYVINQTLDELANNVDPKRFFRANRQNLISKEAVKDINLWFNKRIAVNLCISTPEKIIVSKNRAGEFKEWLTGNR
ncbi:LytR/AlgR family response regulator transcription factor [Phocaeicola vulgatus]|uniref:LytR/AlgR family response regulator transcription factor n=1 Tax=Phocaeicola vulgatus TaxID=821 RepID=UPI003DA4F542